MSKRKASLASGPNSDLCGLLFELSDYERNVTKQIYKANAYRKAALTLTDLPYQISSAKEAKKLPGIGDKIAQKIDEFITSGKIRKIDDIRSDDSVVAMNKLSTVTGIGPTAAQRFFEQGIKSIDDLKKNIDNLNHHQRIGVRYYDEFQQQIPRSEMELLLRKVKELVLELDKDFVVQACGSYRRGADSSGDIDILLTHEDFVSTSKKRKKVTLQKVIDHMKEKHFVTDVLSLGPSKFMGVCQLSATKSLPSPLHRRIDIRFVPHDQYFCALLYFTGSDEFNRRMRQKAIDKGFTLNEYSVRPVGSTGTPGEPISVTCEKDVFDCVGMDFVSPDMRNK